MTNSTSKNKTRNFRFLRLRCGFFSMEYRSYNTCEKIIENVKRKLDIENTNGKIVKKNMKCKIEKNVNLEKKCNRKIVNRDNGIENSKLNGNCKCKKNNAKIENVNTGMKIAEQIVRIGSALSGLLQPLRIVFVKRMAMMT